MTEEHKTGDELYENLLKEATARVLSAPLETMYEQAKQEMEKARDILISSGHDLKDVDDFNSKINGAIADFFAGWGG